MGDNCHWLVFFCVCCDGVVNTGADNRSRSYDVPVHKRTATRLHRYERMAYFSWTSSHCCAMHQRSSAIPFPQHPAIAVAATLDNA